MAESKVLMRTHLLRWLGPPVRYLLYVLAIAGVIALIYFGQREYRLARESRARLNKRLIRIEGKLEELKKLRSDMDLVNGNLKIVIEQITAIRNRQR